MWIYLSERRALELVSSFANYGISNVTEFPCMKKLIV